MQMKPLPPSNNVSRIKFLFLCSMPVILCLIYWQIDPFCQVLVSSRVGISQLSPAQRANIAQAAKALDEKVVLPGQTFSFNQTVGPRTLKRGYLRSPSYLEGDTPQTFGGGICVLSSLLYKSALELGLPITERTAHTRTVHTIAPGFDATVWYGQNDLRFTNNLAAPVKIACSTDGENLSVNLLGKQSRQNLPGTTSTLRRTVVPVSKDRIEVIVLRQEGPKLALVSKDFYFLSK
jgi:vancomycin resistance protein VanW